MHLRLIVVSLAYLMTAPAIVYAQASITGVVRDTSGAVLPGVTVDAASPALIEQVRAAVTDGTGQYRIENLRPGFYTVTFTLSGFAVVRREGIELTGTFVATVNAELRVGTLEETITVTGETPVVDLQSTTRQRVMDREVLDSIPSGRSEYNLGVLIPGVTVRGGGSAGDQDVGGAGTQGAFPSLLVHGSKTSDTTHTMSGVGINMMASTGGFQSVLVNSAATQELAIDTAAGDTEQAVGGVRINRIPREGGNTFNGTFSGSFANRRMQGTNFTEELRGRGLRSPDSIDKNWVANPGFGGPIRRDRLWFYSAYQDRGASRYAAGLFFNRHVNNPDAWTYEPDFSRPVTNDQDQKDGQLRLTWQATRKNKLGVTWQEAVMCYCPLNASVTTALESSSERAYPLQRIIQPDWTVPISSRLLFETGGAVALSQSNVLPKSFLNPLMIPVTEQSTGMSYRSAGEYRKRTERSVTWRGALSYITGAHAFKVGMTHRSGYESEFSFDYQPLNFRFNDGVPNQLTQRARPYHARTHLDHEMGLFTQDRWTLRGLTLTYGVRYDYFTNSFPQQHVGPAALAPTRNITFPARGALTYHDVTPRLGASYDPIGKGKTAVKVSLNKYLTSLGGGGGAFAGGINPVNNLIVATMRAWNDANRNFAPDCDLMNPLANGECGPMANADFGKVRTGATYDGDLLRGWGRRNFNWEFSAGLQQELLPRVAADVSYFRRSYGNFIVTDNRTTEPTDFDPFTIVAPLDPRLPGGGGYVLSGLYDLNPSKFGVPVDNFVTRAERYGKQVEYWHGVDVNLNARSRPGLLLQGGVSTGRTVTDTCEILAKLPEMNVTGLPYCHVATSVLTQVKFLGSYTIPHVEIQVSGTLQSLPGPEIAATYNAPNAEVAPSLGRNLAGGARNVTVNLVHPGTMYGERLNQLDLRVAKILRFGHTRTIVGVDLFNALNSNAVLQENSAFAVWRQPTQILVARFVKLGVQFDF